MMNSIILYASVFLICGVVVTVALASFVMNNAGVSSVTTVGIAIGCMKIVAAALLVVAGPHNQHWLVQWESLPFYFLTLLLTASGMLLISMARTTDILVAKNRKIKTTLDGVLDDRCAQEATQESLTEEIKRLKNRLLEYGED
jgi:hypothetical protein